MTAAMTACKYHYNGCSTCQDTAVDICGRVPLAKVPTFHFVGWNCQLLKKPIPRLHCLSETSQPEKTKWEKTLASNPQTTHPYSSRQQPTPRVRRWDLLRDRSRRSPPPACHAAVTTAATTASAAAAVTASTAADYTAAGTPTAGNDVRPLN